MQRILFSLSILSLYVCTNAQVVIRGPYMQSPTHESVVVMWRTDSPSGTKVWYGTDPANLSGNLQINNNERDHIVKITGLQANTRYYYAVGDLSMQLAGNTSDHHFDTHPIPGTSLPVRVWAIGDFGRGNAGQVEVKQSYMAYSGNTKTNVWLWLGDNAYNDGSDQQYQEKVFAVNGFSDVFSGLPFWPSPGNHDYNTVWSESTLLGIPYTNIALADHKGPYFNMVEVPRYAEAGGYPSHLEVFYSFDYGDVHFLSLNSEVFDYTFSYDGINQMKAWIQQDLQQNTRKFTIAYFHQPPYTKGSHDSDDAYELVMKAMREKVIPLLESFDIDLVVCGHSHIFERSHLIKGHYGNSSSFNPNTMLVNGTGGNFAAGNAYVKDNSYATSEGTVYVVCGNSGSTEDAPSLNHPAMIYSHGGSNAMGSFVIDVNRNRLDGKYLKSTGEIADEFTILKKDMVLAPIVNAEICEGDSVHVAAFYTGGSDSISYAWSNITDSTQAVTIHPTTTGPYTLTVTDEITGQVLSTSFTVTVIPMALPVITEVIAGSLGSSVGGIGYTYQWYINGNIISGANWQYYSPLFSGEYAVLVTDANGCARMSDSFIYTAEHAGIDNLESDGMILYPNPAVDGVTLFIPDNPTGGTYKLMDMHGKIITTGKFTGIYTSISVADYTPGLYVLLVEGTNLPQRLLFTKK